MTLKVLARKGHSRREIARLLGVDESTVRYHLGRMAGGARDRRADQQQRAAAFSEPILHYIESADGGPLNLADLHEWLVVGHGYQGSLRSVERYYRKHCPKPAGRDSSRGASTGRLGRVAAHVDRWSAGPCVRVSFEAELSHSRISARVWAPRKDQLSRHTVHKEAFRRLDGIPATVRVNNERTAVATPARWR